MLKSDTPINQAMQTLAHDDALDWLCNFMRVQLASQCPEQCRFTLTQIEGGLDIERIRFRGHQGRGASQTELEVLLYRRAFAKVSADIVNTIGSPLTMEEATITKPTHLE